jgi:predicted O-methyltransferase YrrM
MWSSSAPCATKTNLGFYSQSFRRFSYNSPMVWHKVVIEHNKLERVQMIVGDINRVEFDPSEALSAALIDVDLYLPTLAAIRKIYDRLVPGGTIVVDDVMEGPLYDGAYQAFHQFVAATRNSNSTGRVAV